MCGSHLASYIAPRRAQRSCTTVQFCHRLRSLKRNIVFCTVVCLSVGSNNSPGFTHQALLSSHGLKRFTPMAFRMPVRSGHAPQCCLRQLPASRTLRALVPLIFTQTPWLFGHIYVCPSLALPTPNPWAATRTPVLAAGSAATLDLGTMAHTLFFQSKRELAAAFALALTPSRRDERGPAPREATLLAWCAANLPPSPTDGEDRGRNVPGPRIREAIRMPVRTQRQQLQPSYWHVKSRPGIASSVRRSTSFKLSSLLMLYI